MVLLLLIDAFRRDYLQKTDFLRYLAASGASGELQEPFGFCPRAAYFAGLSPSEAGYAFQFWRDSARSPFRSAKFLPSDAGLTARGRQFTRGLVSERARSAATAFGASYLDAQRIPFPLLPEFDIAEKYPPWDLRVGYRSLFHEMDESGLRWLYAGWPTLNDYQLRRDCDTVSWVLNHANANHSFVHVQFSELDAAGHVFGPGSAEVVRVLAETDRLTRLLIEGLMARGEPLDVIVFGDHGMVSVVRELDIARHLSGLSVSAPADFLYFLDSTVARFWYNHSSARDQVRELLRSLPAGRLLDAADKEAHQIEKLDPRSGEDFFLVDPGVVVTPCFFHGPGESPRGMHGYDPREPDNRGVFLAAGPHFRPATNAGVVDSRDLYTLCRSLLLDGSTVPAFEPVRNSRNAEYDAVVARDLQAVDRCIAELDPNPGKTVVLSGSFGRGEGGVVDGRAVNDYDILVFSETPVDAAAIHDARQRLTKTANVPFMDLGWFPNELAQISDQTIFRYDLRYGTKVLSGDAGFLDRMPQLAENEISSLEVLRLLCNRSAGMLLAWHSPVCGQETAAGRGREFLWIQVSKAGMALADHQLFRWGAYHTSYAVRRRRFAVLGTSAGMKGETLAGVDRCFAFKLDPGAVLEADDPRHAWCALQREFLAAICERLNQETEPAVQDVDIESAASRYLRGDGSSTLTLPDAARALAALFLGTFGPDFRPIQPRLDSFIDNPEVRRLLPGAESLIADSAEETSRSLGARVLTLWEQHCH